MLIKYVTAKNRKARKYKIGIPLEKVKHMSSVDVILEIVLSPSKISPLYNVSRSS